jgi:hypothetical protein
MEYVSAAVRKLSNGVEDRQPRLDLAPWCRAEDAVMTLHNALRVVRASALYDLITAVGFLPFIAPALLSALAALHHRLGLSGAIPDPTDVYTVLFANLMGGLITVWAVLRLLRPSLLTGAADTAGRAVFAVGMAAALANGASPLVWVMLALEVSWGIVQGAAILGQRGSHDHAHC